MNSILLFKFVIALNFIKKKKNSNHPVAPGLAGGSCSSRILEFQIQMFIHSSGFQRLTYLMMHPDSKGSLWVHLHKRGLGAQMEESALEDPTHKKCMYLTPLVG